MTQEQEDNRNKVARTFEASFPNFMNNPEAGGGFHGVRYGIQYIISNPSDFGLVSMEEMFEFAEWCVGLGYEFYDSLSFGNVYTKPNDKTLKTTAQIFQEFQLFTTQNKEK